MKNESFEFIKQLHENFIYNHYTLTVDEIYLIISLLIVVRNEQSNHYRYNATIFFSIFNMLSNNSQFLYTNKTFYM